MKYNSIKDWLNAGKPLNSFILGDCMEGMEYIEDKYFELAIPDPPYGINANKFNLRTDCHKKWGNNWNDIKPNKEYFDNLFRISNNQLIFGGNYFTKYLYENNNWII